MASVVISILLFSFLKLEKFAFAHQSDDSVISGLKFESMNTFLRTTGSVIHLDEDIFIPGNILYIEDHTLKTTDGKTAHLIAGSGWGYEEGKSAQAKFLMPGGFQQVNSTHLLISSWHCLRYVNRLTNETSLFVGDCRSGYGLIDGYYTNARFFNPWSVIKDVNNLQNVIVVEWRNRALRSVNWSTGEVRTLVRDLPDDPFGAVFQSNKDDLLIIMRKSLGKLNIKTLAFRTLTSATNKQERDGDFTNASFNLTTSILRISDSFHIVVDEGSEKLKLVDMKKSTISSICDVFSAEDYGTKRFCFLRNPRSLLMKSDTLYIGGEYEIRTILVKRISPCNSTTIMLPDRGQLECVEMIPEGENMCYAPEIQNYKINDRNSSVVTKELKNARCPNGINKVADAITLKANVSLLDGGDMTLAVGDYICHKKMPGNGTCAIRVHVTDPRLKNRLDLSARYQLSCPLKNDFMPIIHSVAKMRYHQIKLISSGYCNQSADLDVTMECKNNILSVLWPTDCVFQNNSTKEQEKVVAAINEYLRKSKGSILELVIPNHIPPIIEPIINRDGFLATVVLTAFCSDGLRYLNTTRTCI